MIRSRLVAGVIVAGLALAPASFALAEEDAADTGTSLEAQVVEEVADEDAAEDAAPVVDAPSTDGTSAQTSVPEEAIPPAEAETEVASADAAVPTAGAQEARQDDAADVAEGGTSSPSASPTTEEQGVPSEVGEAEGTAAEVAPDDASALEAEAASGWQTGTDGSTYYYDADGSQAFGERYLDGSDGSGWYYFDDSTGALAHGWRYVASGNKWVYYDPFTGRMWHGEGYVSKDDATTDDPIPGWCYFDDNTGATTYGWKYVEAGNKWVYYDPFTGRMWHGEGYVSKDDATTDDPIPGWCYFDDNTGATTYGWKYVEAGNKWVYYDPYNGRMWHGEGYVSKDDATTDDPIPGWCYFDDATGATTYGWKHLADGRYVYYDTQTGRMYHGTHTIDNKVYVFSSTTGAADKYGYQNAAGYYRVSSSTVWLGHAGDPFSYVTPSRIGVAATREDCVNAFIQRAREYLGTPYVWDYAREPGVGVDCVGLVIQCAYATGMDLGDINTYNHYYTGPNGWHSHDANNLWNSSRAMHVSLADRQRGDVISWAGHVAVYLGNDQIIEAYSPATGVRQTSMWTDGTPRGVIRLFQ